MCSPYRRVFSINAGSYHNLKPRQLRPFLRYIQAKGEYLILWAMSNKKDINACFYPRPYCLPAPVIGERKIQLRKNKTSAKLSLTPHRSST